MASRHCLIAATVALVLCAAARPGGAVQARNPGGAGRSYSGGAPLGATNLEFHCDSWASGRTWQFVRIRYNNNDLSSDYTQGPGGNNSDGGDDCYAFTPQFTSTGTWYWAMDVSYGVGNDYVYRLDDNDWHDIDGNWTPSTLTIAITNLPWSTDCYVTNGFGPEATRVYWTRPGGYNVMAVRREGAWPDAPTGGKAYTNRETYGTDDRNLVIYKPGAASWTNDYELDPEKTYYYSFFTENYNYYSVSNGTAKSGESTSLTTDGFGDNEIVESFAYWAGQSLDGLTNGNGWTDGWDVTDGSYSISAGSLSQISGYPAPYGNKATTAGSGDNKAFRGFEAVTNGRLYVSYMLRHSADQGSSDENWIGAALFSNTTERIYMGKRWGEPTVGLVSGATTADSGSHTIAHNTDYLIVGMYDFDDTFCRVLRYTTSNTVPADEPSSWHASNTLAVAVTYVDSLRLGCGGTGSSSFDEVRMARSWQELINYTTRDPTNISLAADGGEAVDLSWGRTDEHDVMIVRRANAPPTAQPDDDTAYPVGTTLGGGTVIYNGAGTSFKDCQLSADTLYYYVFYCRDNDLDYSPGVTNYVQTAAYASGEIVDPFSYTNGAALDGKNGGNGWTNTWDVAYGTWTQAPGSLAVADIYPEEHGHKLYLADPGNGGSGRVDRCFNTVTSGTLYASCIVQYNYQGANKWAGMGLTSNGTEYGFFGKMTGGDWTTFGLHVGGGTVSSGQSAPEDQAFLAVAKYDFAAGKLYGHRYLYNAAVPRMEPENWYATGTVSIAAINGIRLSAGSSDGFNTVGRVLFDEVRVATRWEDLLTTNAIRVVKDNFNTYTSGNPLSGASGGVGWRSDWFADWGGSDVLSDNLSIDVGLGCLPPNDTDGDKKVKFDLTANDSRSNCKRRFPAYTSGTLYATWIQQWGSQDAARYCGVAFMTNSSTAAFAIGKTRNDGQMLGFSIPDLYNNTTVQTCDTLLNYNTPYIFAVKYDFDNDLLQAKTWVYTDDVRLSNQEPDWQIERSISVPRIDHVRMEAGAVDLYGAVGACYFDELRIGTNWSQVMICNSEYDDDLEGPTPELWYIGTNFTAYSGPLPKTNVYDRELDIEGDKLDIAVRWTDPSGVFLTNACGSCNTNIYADLGRVVPNWDPMSIGAATNAFGLDEVFTSFVGVNGGTIVTTIQFDAFSITNYNSGLTYYVTVSAEDNDTSEGCTTAALGGNWDAIPCGRAVTVNAALAFTVDDDDNTPPELTGFAAAGDAAGAGIVWGSELRAQTWSVTGMVSDASGINVTSNSVTVPTNAPFLQVFDPAGTEQIIEPFDTRPFVDGGATNPTPLAHNTPSAISGDIVSGVWTVRVVVTDNDCDGIAGADDPLTATNEITFRVGTFDWDAGGGADRSWSETNNWTGELEPGAQNTAHVNGGHTAVVSAAGEAVYDLFVGDDGFNATAGTGTGTVWQSGGALAVGGRLALGESAGDYGAYTITGGTLQVSSTTLVGGAGIGIMTVTGGASVAAADDVVVGYGSAGGAEDAGSTLHVGGGGFSAAKSLYLGGNAGADGTLRVSGGWLSVTNLLTVGYAAGSTGAVSVAGGLLNVGEALNIGDGAGGAMTVSGGRVLVESGTLRAGDTDPGALTIEGGAVTTDVFWVADYAGAAGSTFTMSGGQFTVTETGDNAIRVDYPAMLHFSGGTLRAGEMNLSRAGDGTVTVEISGDAQIIGSHNFNVGAGAGETCRVTQHGGRLELNTAQGELRIGFDVGGTFGYYTITGGVIETEDHLIVGRTDGNGTGVFHVVGSASSISVGTDGSAADFNLNDSGHLQMTFVASNAITPIRVGDVVNLGGGLTVSNENSIAVGTYVIITSLTDQVSGTFSGVNWAGGVEGDVVYGDEYVSLLFAPEIEVRGTNPAVTIADNDTTPSTADGTDFGAVELPYDVSHTFTVTNLDLTYPLGLTGTPAVVLSGAHQADFEVTSQPAASIGPGAAAAFTVKFAPSMTGVRTAEVSIANNDLRADANPYTFRITGTGSYADEPAASASNLVFSAVTNIAMTVSWDGGSGSNRLLLARADGSVSAAPQDGSNYTANAAFSNGQAMAAGEYVLYIGSGTNVALTSLYPGVLYSFKLFEFNGVSNGVKYRVSDPLAGSQAAATYAPVITEGGSSSVTVSENGSPTAFSLTLNRTDVDLAYNDTVTWSIRSPAEHGTATASGTNAGVSVGYTPPLYYSGPDRFVVQAVDRFGNADTNLVNVTVEAVNPPGKAVFIFE
jgi:hypothetical protein